MRRPTSLTAGAALAFLAILVVAAVMLIGLLSQRNSTALIDLEERALLGRAAIVSQHLRYDEGGWRLDLPEEMAAAFSGSYGRAAFTVVDGQGNFVTGSNINALLDLPAEDLAGPAPFTVQRLGRTWRGMSVPAVVDGRPVVIRVAENLLHPDVLLDDAAADFLIDVAWIVLPVFLALCGAMLWMLQRVKQPLRSLALQAKRISSAAPGERLTEAAVPSELLPLVLAFNEALGRIEAAQSEQRAFVADAAHELRTPLAVLQAHLDLMRDREAAAALTRDLSVLERMVGQLLTIAALDDRALRPDAALDLRVLASDLVGHLAPLARASDIALQLDLPPAPVTILAEEESLSQAIVNLVENAIGHSPSGSSVIVSVLPDGTFAVSDSGPGVPEHERKLVFRRFWRSRRRFTPSRKGAGLGLAIVTRAAEIHGGTVSVGHAASGGACFVLRLPLLTQQDGGAGHAAA